jgi:hypothetical protein
MSKNIVRSLTIQKVFCIRRNLQNEIDLYYFDLKMSRSHNVMNQLHIPKLLGVIWSSEEAHMVDALAVEGDERRGSLR